MVKRWKRLTFDTSKFFRAIFVFYKVYRPLSLSPFLTLFLSDSIFFQFTVTSPPSRLFSQWHFQSDYFFFLLKRLLIIIFCHLELNLKLCSLTSIIICPYGKKHKSLKRLILDFVEEWLGIGNFKLQSKPIYKTILTN